MTYQRIFILFRILGLIALVAVIYGSTVWGITELVAGMRLRPNMTVTQHIVTMVSTLVIMGCSSWCAKLVLDRLVDAATALMSTTWAPKSEE